MLSTHIKFFKQKLQNLSEEIKSHSMLFDCCFIALGLHIAFIPVMLIMSWLLPWPKPPVFTVTIEYVLDKSTLSYKPNGLTEYREPEIESRLANIIETSLRLVDNRGSVVLH